MMKKGFTLVELIIVIAILILLIAAAIGGIDPIGIINKARDAQRKKDINRIKISFEDYFNDKGCYPDQTTVDKLNQQSNCSSKIFRPWMATWPCDPNGIPYTIQAGYDEKCPKWFKILTSLENKSDKDIVRDWKITGNLFVGTTDINYGVSSGNISLEEITGFKDPHCVSLGECYYYPEANKCNKTMDGCSGANCYLGECSDRCRVSCCGKGCN